MKRLKSFVIIGLSFLIVVFLIYFFFGGTQIYNDEDKKYERYFLSDIKDKLFKNNDHRLLNNDNLTDGSFSRSFPKPSTKIDLE